MNELEQVLAQHPALVTLCRAISVYHNVPPDLGVALVYTESRFKSDAVSPCGAIGLAQIMPTTGEYLGLPERSLSCPDYSLCAGLRYLREQYDNLVPLVVSHPYTEDGNVPEDECWKLAAASYNAGRGWILKALSLGRKLEGLTNWTQPGKYQTWRRVKIVFKHEKCVLIRRGAKDGTIKRSDASIRETEQYVDKMWATYQELASRSD